MDSTVYSEVGAGDTDVAAFVASHPYEVNLLALPIKMWVARQSGKIVALMLLNAHPYLAIDLILAEPGSRPFMRIFKLWKLTEAWLIATGVPIVCVTVNDALVHYQSIVRRFGFEKVGEENNAYGVPVETIYAKKFNVVRKVA